jgi:mannose-6-phosphate isomerase class I
MRTLPATPGEVVFLPAGTIHALGAGVLVYEIQQPSTITYRLDDWGGWTTRGTRASSTSRRRWPSPSRHCSRS